MIFRITSRGVWPPISPHQTCTPGTLSSPQSTHHAPSKHRGPQTSAKVCLRFAALMGARLGPLNRCYIYGARSSQNVGKAQPTALLFLMTRQSLIFIKFCTYISGVLLGTREWMHFVWTLWLLYTTFYWFFFPCNSQYSSCVFMEKYLFLDPPFFPIYLFSS